jgi:hypothetical protein
MERFGMQSHIMPKSKDIIASKWLFPGIGIVFIIMCYSILFYKFLPLSFEWLVIISAVLVILLILLIYYFIVYNIKMPFWLIMAITICLHVPFLFKTPELSNDIYRYLWDGLLWNIGINPYAFKPSDIYTLNSNLQELYKSLDHRDFFTIYPPFAQIFFGIASLLFHNVFGLKLILGILDIFTCFFILRSLQILDKPLIYSVLYAWHPLVILEISGSGHIDGLAIFLLSILFFLFFKMYKKYSFSNVTLSILAFLYSSAFLVKLFPIVFMPIFFFCLPIRQFILFFLCFCSGCIFFTALFYPYIINMFTTLSIYIGNWEFSNIIFKILHHLSNSAIIPRVIMSILFVVMMSIIYLCLYKKIRRITAADILLACYYITLTFLIVSPTLHPWYGLYLVFFLPFIPRIEGIVLSFSLLLSYRVLFFYITERRWIDDSFMASLVLLGPLLAILMQYLLGPHKISTPESCSPPQASP